MYFHFCNFVKLYNLKGFFSKNFARFYEKKNIWNIRRFVDESFVPSAQQTSVLYCRLKDFMSSQEPDCDVCLAKPLTKLRQHLTGIRTPWCLVFFHVPKFSSSIGVTRHTILQKPYMYTWNINDISSNFNLQPLRCHFKRNAPQKL